MIARAFRYISPTMVVGAVCAVAVASVFFALQRSVPPPVHQQRLIETLPPVPNVTPPDVPSQSAVAAPSLAGTSWEWLRTEYQSQKVIVAPEGGRFGLSFGTGSNDVAVLTDCNSVAGAFMQDGEVLSFGPFRMTKMYCAGSLESVYLQDLSLTSAVAASGDTIRLLLHREYGVMVFQRK